mmetsp:Transcript_3700/g.5470  ORF Transcript_3700/g.5470 Transcript_3700/m.5470 type:complete len:250 (+) Transcript_3700:41-790(+)
MAKTAIITGASAGIGAQVAIDLAKQGLNVVLLARRVELCEKLVKEGKIAESQALCLKCDVTNYDDVAKAVEAAEKKWADSPIDLMVNNAGLMALNTVENQPLKDVTTMLNVNIAGVINGVKAVVKAMKKGGQGTIVNVSSIAGIKPFPNHTVYCGTKYAVHGITQGLRHELRTDNIRVMVCAPGAVMTDLLKTSNSQETVDGYKQWLENCGGEMLRSEDVSASILFAYNMPQRVCIRNIELAGTTQDDI